MSEPSNNLPRLKNARKMKGLSLRAAALGLKMSHEALRKYENGKIKMDSAKLIEFANYYGVTTDSLMATGKPEVLLTNIKFHKIRLPH